MAQVFWEVQVKEVSEVGEVVLANGRCTSCHRDHFATFTHANYT